MAARMNNLWPPVGAALFLFFGVMLGQGIKQNGNEPQPAPSAIAATSTPSFYSAPSALPSVASSLSVRRDPDSFSEGQVISITTRTIGARSDMDTVCHMHAGGKLTVLQQETSKYDYLAGEYKASSFPPQYGECPSGLIAFTPLMVRREKERAEQEDPLLKKIFEKRK